METERAMRTPLDITAKAVTTATAAKTVAQVRTLIKETKAAQAALAYQRTYFPQEPLISLIHSENKPSIKLAQKLGASFSLGREMGNIQVLEFSYPDHA